MIERFTVRYGKWGAYHYDTEAKKDLTLQEVTDLLNLENQQEELAELSNPVCETCRGSGRKSIKPIITQSDFPRSTKFAYAPLPQTEPCPKGCKPPTGQPEAFRKDNKE